MNQRSENEFEGELRGPRATHLIERIKDAQRVRERARGLSKSRLTESSINSSETGMIKDVEGLCTKLQLQALIDRKIPPNGQVHLPSRKPASKISWSVANA